MWRESDGVGNSLSVCGFAVDEQRTFEYDWFFEVYEVVPHVRGEDGRGGKRSAEEWSVDVDWISPFRRRDVLRR